MRKTNRADQFKLTMIIGFSKVLIINCGGSKASLFILHITVCVARFSLPHTDDRWRQPLKHLTILIACCACFCYSDRFSTFEEIMFNTYFSTILSISLQNSLARTFFCCWNFLSGAFNVHSYIFLALCLPIFLLYSFYSSAFFICCSMRMALKGYSSPALLLCRSIEIVHALSHGFNRRSF